MSGGGELAGRHGTGEAVALAELDAEFAEHVELVVGLDALGDDTRAGLAGEGDDGGDEAATDRVAVDAADDADVELDELGGELEDVDEARVAGTGVVDGEACPGGAQAGERAAQAGIVVDLDVLGQLDHHATGLDRLEDGGDLLVGERLAVEVDGEEGTGGNVGHGGEGAAGSLELQLDPLMGGPGLGEPDVRGAMGLHREPGEGFGAGELEAAQVDDGLEQDVEAAAAEDAMEALLEGDPVDDAGQDDVGDEGRHGLVVDDGIEGGPWAG